MRRCLWFCLFSGLLVLAVYALAEELDGEAIVRKMTDRTESQSLLSETKMTLVDAQGNQRVRTLRARMKKINGRRHVVTTFLSPADVRGVKFLVIENPGGDDDQRLFLPEIRRVRRIAVSNQGESFMGSTFSYYDLQSHDADEGKHKRLADMALNGQDCYVVSTVPIKQEETQYSKIIYWVRKDNFVPIRGEFFNKEGKLWKVLEVFQLTRQADGTWLAKYTKMSDVLERKATLLETLSYQIDAPIDDSYFSDRFLTDTTQE